MAGGGPITSLPKHVLAALARSLAMYSSMPEEIAWGHIKARGFDPPELDGQGARMRGALLKILADEVLAESKAESEGDGFEPESTSKDEPKKERDAKKKPNAKPTSSTETHVTRAVGAADDDDSSSDDEVVSRAKPAPETRDTDEDEDEDEDDDDNDDDDDDDAVSDAFSEDSEEEEADNWFGKAATEAPPPPGANPFAAAEAMDLAEEAAEQIKAAKAVVAARFAGAEAAAALASGVGALGLREGEEKLSTSAKAEDEAVKEPTDVKDPKDSAAKEEKAKVAFTKEAVSAAAAAETLRSETLRSAETCPPRRGGSVVSGGGSTAPSEHDGAEEKLDVASVAGSDFPGSDAGTSAYGGSVAGSVAATHGSEEPPRVDETLSALYYDDDGASVATSRGPGGPLEEDEGEYGSEGGDESGAESDRESDEDKENDPAPRRRVVRARRPPPTRAVSREDETPVVVAAAAAAAEAQAQAEEKA
jgi:hypothetical protein